MRKPMGVLEAVGQPTGWAIMTFVVNLVIFATTRSHEGEPILSLDIFKCQISYEGWDS